MPIIAKEPERKYDPCPEGLHPAVCIDVVDLGLVPTQWGDKQKVKLRFHAEVDVDSDEAGRKAVTKGYSVTKWYTLSLNEKATLRKDLETWRGRKFTPAELQGFDLEKLIGVNCQIQVMHAPSDDGGMFARIVSIIPASKHTPRLRVPADYVRECDRDLEPATETAGVDDDPIPF